MNLQSIESYLQREPFDHLILRDVFDGPELRRAIGSWPSATNPAWRHHRNGKRAMNKLDAMSEELQSLLRSGYSEEFRQLAEESFGLRNLIPDWTFFGAGLHETDPGGRLGMHVDFNSIESPDGQTYYRRVNMLLFLNEGWTESQSGELCIGKNKEVRILPELGTLVMFPTTEDSWHGHPDPVRGSQSRRSLAWYWYTLEQPVEYEAWHSTIYERGG